MIYKAPSTIVELQEILDSAENANINILAGGTDVMPRWPEDKSLQPDVLVDIKKIKELHDLHQSDSELRLGPLITVQEIKKSPVIQSEFRALSDAARQFGGVQICHRATIGGNICNASPAGDLLPGLYAHNAEIEIFGPNGNKKVPIQEFITGVGQTALEDGEIVTSIIIPKTKEKSIFYKLGLRQSMAIAVVNFAITYELEENNHWKSLQIAAGSVAPTVVYLNAFTDSFLNGGDIDESIQLVDKDITPIDDIRATANYRRLALKNVIRYFIRHKLHEPNE